MALSVILAVATAVIAGLLHQFVVYPLVSGPLARIPGPKLYAFTKWRLAWDEWNGERTRTINKLHQKYGPVVRIGPNEVHFNSLSALRTIYGAGSGFERTSFYSMFDVYGKKNLFTFPGVMDHAKRKRLVAHAYSKSAILKGHSAEIIGEKIRHFISLVQRTSATEGMEIFSTLHYYAIDAITAFLYGTPELGATSALGGTEAHITLLNDIMDPTRRRLSWFAVHMPSLTAWMYTRTKFMERLIRPMLPMQKPATYTGIRAHALQAMSAYRDADASRRSKAQESIIARLWKTKEDAGLSDLDIACECADHLLAGIDTTSDTLMFLIWALSRRENANIQRQLIAECRDIEDEHIGDGVVNLEVADRLPYLDAVIKETLRLYAALPASEPRSSPMDMVIDGCEIPAGTVCSMSPYSLHRNAEVFPEPLRWDPERWLVDGDESKLSDMKKWFWAFSSGARMCIGMHLAMAEMALVPSIYRQYSTRIRPDFQNIAPGITSRFEIFTDESFTEMKEHTCWIQFGPHSALGDFSTWSRDENIAPSGPRPHT